LYSELLREDESLSAENEESLEIIHSQTEKLRFLVDSLVKLSRLENGIVSLHTGKNSLRELVHCAVTDLSNKAEQKGLSLTESYDFEDEGEASFDEKWTYEALVNLIDNAIKYTEKGSVEVRVSVSDVFARIDVKDTGIGIPKKDVQKIWDRFYKADQSRGKDKHGTGLGLSIVKSIINAHGENIDCISTEGVGTEFVFTLPVAYYPEQE
jgi:signal transduction histidine kinase